MAPTFHCCLPANPIEKGKEDLDLKSGLAPKHSLLGMLPITHVVIELFLREGFFPVFCSHKRRGVFSQHSLY